MIALCLDLFDYTVGWIPIAGDVVDIIGIAILLPFIGAYALLGTFELVPFIGDLSPTFLVAVALSRTRMLEGTFGGLKGVFGGEME
jgi:hypothetical protein